MARKPRVEFAGALCHVIARGNNRQRVFRNPQDYRAYVRRLETYRGRYAMTLYAYVLMPNHIHLLLETGPVPLSKFMQGLQQSYTVYFNRQHRHVGHLFQGRYRAILCDRESYLLELIRYLHLNPVRAELVRHPEMYPWSSHHAYLGKSSELRVATHLPLGHFSNRPHTAVRRYSQFIREGLSLGHRHDMYPDLDQRFLGTDQFVTSVEQHVGTVEHREPPKIPRATLDQYLAVVSRHVGVAATAIRSNARLHRLVQARRLFSFLACRQGGHPVKEAARFLGVDPSGVTNALRSCDQRLSADSGFAAEVEAIVRTSQERFRKFRNV